jgi:hypothetical protein
MSTAFHGPNSLLLSTLALAWAPAFGAWAEDEPVCARYRAVETVPFGREVEVVGRCCRVDLDVRPLGADKIVLEGSIPVSSFDSDHRLRDRHVVDLFAEHGASPVVRFVSLPLEREVIIRRLNQTGEDALEGTLLMAGPRRSWPSSCCSHFGLVRSWRNSRSISMRFGRSKAASSPGSRFWWRHSSPRGFRAFAWRLAPGQASSGPRPDGCVSSRRTACCAWSPARWRCGTSPSRGNSGRLSTRSRRSNSPPARST